MKPSSTLQHQIFLITSGLALMTILFIGIYVASILYRQGIENAESLLRSKNELVATQIQSYVAPFRKSLEYASHSLSDFDHSRFKEAETREKILGLYEILQNSIPYVGFIFSGYEDGSLLINHYTPPEDFNATTRPWYVAAIESHPLISDGLPYQEIKSGEWMVSFAQTLSDTNGHIFGVMSIDASMDAIMSALSNQDDKYPTLFNYATDTAGEVLVHSDHTLSGQVHQHLPSQLLNQTNPSGMFSYHNGYEQRLSHYTRIDDLGWIIFTEVKLADIRKPILKKVISTLIIVILASILTTWMISFILSRYLITPLRKLQTRVQEITDGKSQSTHYVFPNNEIGMISIAIEKLTEKALFQKNIELNDKNRILKSLSNTDQLTGIANRRKMLEVLTDEIRRFKRNQQPFCIFMFDVDHFKRINDTYGHTTGDKVLMQLAHVVRKSLRETDTLGRWGGEEFLFVCPGIDLETAETVAKKVFVAINGHKFPKQLRVTISLGLSEFTANHTLDSILVEVDQKMYQAKQAGRNQMII